MKRGEADVTSDQRVLVVDPDCTRRARLVGHSSGLRIVEAASLCEAFPLAEHFVPDIMAIAADFAVEPEVEGLIRLAGLTRSRVFLYSAAGQALKRRAAVQDLPCVPLQGADTVGTLLARLSDPRTHRRVQDTDGNLPDLILIGASTGGVAALEEVLSAFPADCPPTLVVLHIRDGFAGGLVKRLDRSIRPRVAEAEDGARLASGTVYFGTDSSRHLVLSGMAVPRCALLQADPRHGHRPSVDMLFESAVPFAPTVSAALLTGMGADGAAGLAALRKAGAHTIAQDRDSSVVWGMPRAAVEAGAAVDVLPLDRIGHALLVGGLRPVAAERRST